MDADDEAKRHNEVARGQAAADLMTNPLLADAFAGVEQAYVEAWAQNRSPDGKEIRLNPDGRERLWNAVQVIRTVKAALEEHIRTGKLARRQIEDAAGVKRGIFGR